MIHPNTELKFINNVVGYGMVATEFIPAGTITWALDKLDTEYTQKEFNNMEPVYQEIMEIWFYVGIMANT